MRAAREGRSLPNGIGRKRKRVSNGNAAIFSSDLSLASGELFDLSASPPSVGLVQLGWLRCKRLSVDDDDPDRARATSTKQA